MSDVHRRRIREVVHVSSGMREDGGGTAHLGRLLGASLRRLAARRGLAFRGLHLPALDGGAATDGYEAFADSKIRLTFAVLTRLVRSRGRAVFLFDHVGPARSLAFVPDALLPRYAIQLHGIEIWRSLSNDRLRTIQRAALLIANSSYTAQRSAEFFPSGDRMRVVLLGVEPRVVVGCVDDAVLAAAGTGYALIVGRTAAEEAYKGHDELLNAWTELRERFPRSRLVVVGSGNDLNRLRARALALGLEAAVVFTGQVDAPTLAELYRRSAFFAFPSRLEGFGLVCAEAMAMGKACLALSGTAPAEVVESGKTGLLVPASEPGALVAALETLFGDESRTRTMGEAGRRRYESEFTANAFERRLEPVLEELVGS